MTRIGSHLLGRVASTPDPRDYQMRDFLAVSKAWDDADLAATIGDAYAAGHLHTYADGLRLVRYLKSRRPSPSPTAAVSWHDAVVLDQGDTSRCVGFGWCGWGDCAPIEDAFTNADGDAVYYAAKVIDGEPKAETGSSVRSGAKAMQNRGKVASYYFAASIADVRDWVSRHGPVVMGTDWHAGMFHPDAAGYTHPTGPVVGGHCYLLVGYDPATSRYEFVNSWGESWGRAGRFYMAEPDVAALLAAGGEACAAVEK
jgi:hypothetical protein